VSVSLGHVHGVLEAATQQASVINQGQDLSGMALVHKSDKIVGSSRVPG
jgi:hypothetical protein